MDNVPHLGPSQTPVQRPPSPRLPNTTSMPPPRGSSPTRATAQNPFNFSSHLYVPASPETRAVRAGQRRGHRYKHSSVSMNFFQEPEPKAPLAIPVSHAIPTILEWWQSVTSLQYKALAWCLTRLVVGIFVFIYASMAHGTVPGSTATLAHLVAYDTTVGVTLAAADVLGNFDAWKMSSLRFPFALQRVEVLLGFALAVLLVFVGADIISHTIQHATARMFGGDSHHHNGDTNIKMHFILVALSLAATAPSLSDRMGKVTAIFALVVLIVPLVSHGEIIDALLTPGIGASMIWLGWSSAKLYGGMLVMSYDGHDASGEIATVVSADPSVITVSDISLWQVHQSLWLASMRVKVSGGIEDERRVRELATQTVRKVFDAPDVTCDTTIDITRG